MDETIDYTALHSADEEHERVENLPWHVLYRHPDEKKDADYGNAEQMQITHIRTWKIV